MKQRNALKFGAAISLVVSGALPTTAQDKMKMTTEIPSSIMSPGTVETRIGTLKLTDGFPDDATVTKVYDNLDFQRGLQAYLAALPAVSIAGFLKGLSEFGAVNQTVLISEQLLDAKSLFLTANTTTVYNMLYLDTKNGPLVLEIPPEVLGPIDDAWFRWITDVGITGPDKGKGGKYLLLPPGYTGAIPEGYHVARSRTFGNLMFFRTFLKDGDPKPGVESVKKDLRVYQLSQATNPPPMKFVNVSGKAFNTIGPGDYSLFEYINRVIQDEPIDAVDPDTLGVFAAIGIEKGKPFAPDARMKKILMDAAAVGDATARTLTYRTRIKEAFFYPNSAWVTPFIGGSYKFEENGAVNLAAKAMFFFYATGVTPAMTIKMVGEGSQYAGAFVDAKGSPLDGSKTYRIRMPPNIPAKDFWSFTVYDNQTRSMLQTDQQSPAVGSLSKGLVTNPDGSVDVYFGPKAPAGKESNWAQTIPGKGWNTLLRLYGPLEPWFNKTWRPGEIEPM
ncbi:DUF1254 domain-containing protein [Bradyrhizobium valentinum]|uniref:DUF1254 domain-containing protein n=1 Tax=Bradyrhizobium valentinum TaxID=1518501 RepID=UPI00070C9FC6|nr:DUF1254 domain-containing protein [Bradyrhizobium valentinum]KRR11747.1 hypothetical protein CQ10_39950 [Bradyrhizobium valentinum]